MFDKILDKITIPLIGLIVLLVSINISWHKDHWRGIIESDGSGYYAYLPAVFIYQDLNFGFFDEIEKEKYYHENIYYDYRYDYNGKVIDKYFVGTAIPMLPFFILGHAATLLSDHPPDGYSKLYHIFINIAAIFYLIIACIFLKRLLRLYNIGDRAISLTLFAIVFGTNAFYYTIGEPSMSHIYSFAFITMFCYFSKRYFKSNQMGITLLLALLLGLICLIRPVNAMIILILPFLAGGIGEFKNGIRRFFENKKIFLGSLAIFVAIIFIQPLIYKIQTGEFFIYTYEGEGFNFFKPAIFEILFSYKKGLFLYTPLLLISLFGLRSMYSRGKFEFYSLILFLGFLTYVLSSWWSWWYGGSFSSRVYMDYLSLFAILLGLAIQSISVNLVRKAYIGLVMALVIVCQIQTFQYRYYYIHWSEMTKEKYWDVFLRVDLLVIPKQVSSSGE